MRQDVGGPALEGSREGSRAEVKMGQGAGSYINNKCNYRYMRVR